MAQAGKALADIEEARQPLIARQSSGQDPEHCHHVHYSHRAPWLRAFVLGANDGLVSVASLMLGVGAGTEALRAVQLSGLAGMVAGALSMACGEYISVASQKDTEEADIEKERLEQLKGPEAQQRELDELAAIYMQRGLREDLAKQVATELTAHDVIRAHARDELGIDMDDLANPLQASLTSALAFSLGAAIPLLAGAFVADALIRVLAVTVAATAGLILMGGLGAYLGDASVWKGSARVLIGGWLAMALTYGVGWAFNVSLS
eukprot:GHUV01010344.1.p1 GENE.GHUV01010344.1~~GHUV01010344.1.p1  ORF type:complete len:263 (+),score=54.54 GHUV01010344.1:301-1089(+)